MEENPNLDGLKDIATRSFHISIASTINNKKDKFDVYIEPQDLKKYGYFNVKEGKDLFKIGYDATIKSLNS